MEIYHVLNRGVDKRKIFLDQKDYVRFIHDLFEFNDEEKVFDFGRFLATGSPKNQDIRYPDFAERRPRKFIVHILAFSLMPNHYHLLLQSQTQGGVPLFMRKLNGGYSRYFNKKYQRSGALFQGRYKSVSVQEEGHLLHLPYYIHCNPLDLTMPEWRRGHISNPEQAMNFLEHYRWSSFPDYVGIKNFPSVTQRDFLMEFYGGSAQYKKEFTSWLKNMQLDLMQNLLLEK